MDANGQRDYVNLDREKYLTRESLSVFEVVNIPRLGEFHRDIKAVLDTTLVTLDFDQPFENKGTTCRGRELSRLKWSST